MSYTSVFGGNTIYPSDVSYLALALDANTELEWPLENSGTLPPAARIIDVTPDAAGRSVTLPDATLTGAGQVILFNNLSGSYSFFVKDNAGNTIATVGFGEQWELYLAATTTAAGTWRVFRFGASTANVQPSSLAGFGLVVTGSTLSQSAPVTTFSTTGLTLSSSNRASVFVWGGTGAGTINLPTAAGVGNNYFVMLRNEGGGDLVIEPSGTELINGAPNLALRPGDSATAITDGVRWYTIGLGQEAVFAFDYTSITVTGGNYTLSGSELNRIAYKFVGALTSDVYIIVPATIQQYWVNNATTGAFNFFIQTATGTPVQINQGAKGIYYCDGINLVLGSDPTTLTTPIVISDGGTGATTASGARLNLGITAFADPIVTATSGSSVRTVIGAAASGANSDITSLSGLTTPLSIAQGGTDASTASGARTNLGLGTMATQNSNSVSISGGTISGITDLAVADGGTGASDAATARTNLGLGTIATQDANNVAITGGAISGVTLSTTGAPTAPTASPGTNNTQIATTAFVQAALRALYPVGSVYINAAVATNPATLLGFGTWVEVGAGRVLVGQNTSDGSFTTMGQTGGSKDTPLIVHQHSVSGSTSYASLSGSVDFTTSGIPNYSTSGIITQFGTSNQGQFGSGTVPGGFTVDASHSHTISGATDFQGSSSGSNANLQPYVVVKMWQRTA